MKTNNLKTKFKLINKENGEIVIATIRLNDECRNGRQDFAITADVYEKEPLTQSNCIGGGCMHKKIVAAKPELQIFVDLHSSDANGVPMYAVENGFYHLRKGFNNTKPNDPNFAGEFCKYYRITPEQFDVLNTSENQIQFALNIQKLGILEQWKAQADKAIQLLETMTGETFVNDSVKSQFHAPTKEQIDAENEKIKSGYYTTEGKAERAAQALQAQFDALETEKAQKIELATIECDLKSQVLTIAGKDALDNCIVYTHSKQLGFNWSSSSAKINQSVIDTIAEKITLPEGYTILNKG